MREIGGCVVRFLFVTRKTIVRFTASAVVATILGMMFAGHDGNMPSILVGIGMALAIVAALLVVRLIVARDGWYDDRPRALILPVGGGAYLTGLLIVANGVGLLVGMLTAGAAYAGASLFGWFWSLPITPQAFALVASVMMFLLTGFQAAGAIISRRGDSFNYTLVTGTLLANALAARVTSVHTATPHAMRRDPLIGTAVSVMLLALVFVFWRAVRAYDTALDFHRKA